MPRASAACMRSAHTHASGSAPSSLRSLPSTAARSMPALKSEKSSTSTTPSDQTLQLSLYRPVATSGAV
eukprot:3310196-Rhodomonas_salina.1